MKVKIIDYHDLCMIVHAETNEDVLGPFWNKHDASQAVKAINSGNLSIKKIEVSKNAGIYFNQIKPCIV
jgi:hypothetical protein